MDRVGKNIYFLATMPALFRALETGVFFHDSAATPLGRVTMAGQHHPGPGIPHWRTLRHYALVLPLQGSAQLETKGAPTAIVQPGDLFWLFPGIAHRYHPQSRRPWAEFWLLFDGPLFEAWRGSLLNPRKPALTLGNTTFWLNRLRWSLWDNQRAPLQAVTRVARLNLVMSELWQFQQRARFSAADRNWLELAQAALQQSITKSTPLPQVARSLRCGYDVFRRRFRKLSGISPAQYRHRLKLDQCAELLLYDNYSNKELAERFHFSSEFHFSREFTRHTGLSPRAFAQKAIPVKNDRSSSR